MPFTFPIDAIARTRRGDQLLRIAIADRFATRLRGLMFEPPLVRTAAGTEGLLLTGCTAVHGCFIAEPLDIVFLCDRGRVTGTSRLARFGWTRAPVTRWGLARHTLELPSGSIARLGVLPGDWVLRRPQAHAGAKARRADWVTA